MGSVTVTPVAFDGPAFVTVIVNVTLSPGWIDGAEAVFVIRRSVAVAEGVNGPAAAPVE